MITNTNTNLTATQVSALPPQERQTELQRRLQQLQEKKIDEERQKKEEIVAKKHLELGSSSRKRRRISIASDDEEDEEGEFSFPLVTTFATETAVQEQINLVLAYLKELEEHKKKLVLNGRLSSLSPEKLEQIFALLEQ